ncbi:VOC family protein [Jannaschia sp. M317]|uniref:VOC family protein n=1 Tax=Jannaschia sp. M317 TaxID=2867011 RepID=UPI0021A39305|nr:VOC family protein [Jannaschia sp. M317]UWQ16936.1 VOC family protein [Jannaschia sp. M317]
MTTPTLDAAPVAGTGSDHAAIWVEIPVRDLDKGRAFYGAVLGQDMTETQMGPDRVSLFRYAQGPGVGGHIYPGKPAADGTGPTVHLTVPAPLEAAMDRVWQAGGKVLGEPVQIPVGRFAYIIDPDGNSVGLFEV